MAKRDDMTCTTCGDVAVPESFIVDGVVSSSCFRCRADKPARCHTCFHQEQCCTCHPRVIDEIWEVDSKAIHETLRMSWLTTAWIGEPLVKQEIQVEPDMDQLTNEIYEYLLEH